MARVVVPGGLIMVLEMAFTRNWFSNLSTIPTSTAYCPALPGGSLSTRAAYYYLADSIMNFPSPAEFSRLMQEAGMVDMERHKLTFGATYLYTGRKEAARPSVPFSGPV